MLSHGFPIGSSVVWSLYECGTCGNMFAVECERGDHNCPKTFCNGKGIEPQADMTAYVKKLDNLAGE